MSVTECDCTGRKEPAPAGRSGGHILACLGGAIRDRITNIGRLPICNQNASHAPKIGCWCMPLCWRCTGIVLGILTGLWLVALEMVPSRSVPVGILMMVPCALDVAAQRWLGIVSTSGRRLATGLMAGIAIELL